MTFHWIALVVIGATLSGFAGCSNGADSGDQTSQAGSGPATKSVTAFDFSPKISPGKAAASISEPVLTTPFFVDRAKDLGVAHEYQNGATGAVLMVEALGGGVAWTDFDRDGQVDLYFTQGGNPAAESPGGQPGNALFRNTRGQVFKDATSQARVGDSGYGQGIAVGDFDNDGFDDIYVTNVGPNVLYRNMGDGTFTDTTAFSSTQDSRWSSSAAWADMDLDGDVDLYVCNYLQYDPRDPMVCEKDGQPALCHPRQLEAWPDEYFENLGNGVFRARAKELGLQGAGNKGLGLAIADFNNNGRPDIYVCNDTTENFLFTNHVHQTFERVDQQLGAGLSAAGNAQASMGIAVGDYDSNGLLDIYLSHFTGESNALYRNEGEYGFQEVSGLTGVRQATLSRLGFGTVMADFNFDGRQDILTANGHIDEQNADGDGFRQKPQLLTFVGNKWTDCSQSSGDYFQQNLVGRGLATGDMDNDGDLDVAVVNQRAAAAVLDNRSQDGHWLKLRCIGRSSNRNGTNTRVEYRCGSLEGIAELIGGTSYCATNEPTLTIGLGQASDECTLSIRWPTGTLQTIANVAVDQEMTIIEPRSAEPSTDHR
ncbi:MAG: CRTAC1 family protein [Fuerstiella sp.]|nr:CRTAC1 family protein [Fuerstiella sp.]MCP4855728.1 CRTAC1 family protein [Fuerstiella sp.]